MPLELSPPANRSPTPRPRWTCPVARSWTSGSSAAGWSTRPTAAGSRSSSSAPAWPAPRPRRRSASSATGSSRSGSTTAPGGRTASPRRAGSTPRRTTATTATACYRLFYDTVKGGDFRSRESNSYRLAEVSAEHHRPGRRPGRAVRPRVRRPARQPLVRWRPGVAHLLRPRPDGPAAAARRLPGAGAADRRWATSSMHARTEMLDLVVVDGRAPRHRRPRPDHRRGDTHFGGRRRARPPAATATSSTSRPTPRAATSPRSGGRTSAARTSPTPATRRSTRPASRCSGEYQSKLTLMSESLRNDGRVWVPKERGDDRDPRADPRGRARLLPRAQVPGVRQPGAPRHRLARGQERCATRAAASARDGLASTSTSPTRSTRLGRDGDRGASTATSSTCTTGSPARTRTRRRCGSTPPSTTRWAGCGSTTTCMTHHPGPVRARRGQLLRPRRQPPRAPARSCRAWPTATSCCRPRSATTSPHGPFAKVADRPTRPRSRPCSAVETQIDKLLSIKGTRTRRLVPPRARARSCGTSAAWRAPRRACARRWTAIPELREEFWTNVKVLGERARSTRPWRRPAGSPTSSSSPS